MLFVVPSIYQKNMLCIRLLFRQKKSFVRDLAKGFSTAWNNFLHKNASNCNDQNHIEFELGIYTLKKTGRLVFLPTDFFFSLSLNDGTSIYVVVGTIRERERETARSSFSTKYYPSVFSWGYVFNLLMILMCWENKMSVRLISTSRHRVCARLSVSCPSEPSYQLHVIC